MTPTIKFLFVPVIFMLFLSACTPAQTASPTAAASPSGAGPSAPAVEEHPEWAADFKPYDVSGAFILYDMSQNRTLVYNPAQVDEPFLPASTFKILNSLIALETGVLQGPDTAIKWDGTMYPNPTWNKDQTMRSAFQNSVVWYYQEVARRIGADRMKQYVNMAGYGNCDISGSLDSFWLDGGLRISAREQVDFIRRLVEGDLPFSPAHMQTVRDLMIVEQKGAYTLHAKTGMTAIPGGVIGWYVGYVERGGKSYVFALNMTRAAENDTFMDARITVTRQILQSLGLIDPPG